MKAFVITIKGHVASERGASELKTTLDAFAPQLEHENFDAIVPVDVDQQMIEHQLVWNYPWKGKQFDAKSGMVKNAYPTEVRKRRIACALSHYNLWKRVANQDWPAFIFEHDAILDTLIPEDFPDNNQFQIVGINNPFGATRLASKYHNAVQSQKSAKVVPVPLIDEIYVPQGLAGNSAYYMTPQGAKRMINNVKEYGLWPNDALMCRQLLPKILGQSTIYYSRIQGMVSTTSR